MKYQVFAYPEFPGLALQRKAIRLALFLPDVRMGGAEHNVNGLGVLGDDRGEGVDHRFDAFARREQTKSENHLSTFHSVLVLVEVGVHKGNIGNAVMYEGDLLRGDVVDLPEDVFTAPAHNDQPIGQLGDAPGNRRLGCGRCLEYGVERSHQGHAEVCHQIKYVSAVLAAEDPELVLQADDFHPVHVEEVRSETILSQRPLVDLEPDLGRIGVSFRYVVHNHGPVLAGRILRTQRCLQVCSEGCNPAPARHKIADKGNLAWIGMVCSGLKHVGPP
ncbi:MAG: hypothetical protein A4E57_04595 [Syntrophorhabdaceae bacterium PtaU1.Bin034]|nr:MAG: hypothetical protein A4E57_04595 [Syntrophorhabdaceae bacterium PtaU1.Bin034]